MSKWSVTIHQSNRNGSSSPKCRWVVDPPGYNHKNRNWGDHRWHVAGGKWFAWGSEVSKREAWEEALAYADQRARTREVVLPRLENITRLVAHNGTPDRHPTGYHIVTNDPEYYYAVRMKKPRHNRHNLHTPRPARALIEKYRHEKQQRPTFRWR